MLPVGVRGDCLLDFLDLFLLRFLWIWSGTVAEGEGQEERRQLRKWETEGARESMSIPWR